jgi:ABC-type multidrug transport system fused ATPase/permease subunit
VYGGWYDRAAEDDEKGISKERGAPIFRLLLFTWLDPLIKLGTAKSLEQEDIWNLTEKDASKDVLGWYYSFRNPQHSLYWRIFKLSAPIIVYQWCCSLLSASLSFAGPLFLYQIITSIQVPNVDRIVILPSLLGLFACSCTKAIIDAQMYFSGRRVGLRARTVLIDELYQKSLHRVQGTHSSDSENEQASLGKIVTLMSVDTERIREFLSYTHDFLLVIPISIVISISSLFLVLGWSAFVGIGLVLFFAPVSSMLGRWIVRLQAALLKTTDKRVTIMNELLQGVRIIKYFAWEEHFKSTIQEARENELKSIVRLWGARIAFNTIGSGSGIIIAFSTFAMYTLVAGKELDAATAFTAINLLRVVTQLLTYLPYHVMMFFNAKVSIDRISDFLKEQEIEKHEEIDSNLVDRKITLGFRNASVCYYGAEPKPDSTEQSSFMIKDLNIEFPSSKLSLICGPTGSGKTSLLMALLGEMKLLDGQIFLPKNNHQKIDPITGLKQTVAYAAQTAWLLNATVRDNILFGEPYDEERYEQVIRGCALAKDLENLEGGDLTEIGEKGINLSGGQKQRISLARACYSRAAYVLLDDPLSAVDAPTARFLLHKSLLGLLKGRTVILVSHATHLVVPFADHVVVMKNGEVSCQGAPSMLTRLERAESLFGLDLTQDVFDDEKEGFDGKPRPSVVTAAGEGTTLVQKEEKATGSVRFTVYKSYFDATGGLWFFGLFMMCFMVTAGARVANDWWLKHWTDHATPSVASTFQYHEQYSKQSISPFSHLISSFSAPGSRIFPLDLRSDAIFYVGVYAMFGLGVIVAANVQTLTVLSGSLFASRRLHTKLLTAILYSPLRFFEVTPVGRILNRFSKDIESIDNQVIGSIQFFMDKIIQGATILAVIGTIAPVFLLIVPFIAMIYLYVARLYLNASRELKRFESTTKSPLYAQFSETLVGVCTLRAYGVEERFIDVNRQKIDENHKPFFFVWAANRWLCLRTDLISALVVVSAGSAVVFGGVEAGWAAITITYALDFTNALLWAVRMHAEMEMSMNCVERVQEYIQVEQEPPSIIEGSRPDPEWPHEGTVQVKELSIRYAPDLPDVLKKVSFNILPNEKVAVVGRTGAGKSTLSLAFFRIIPLSGGSITIDGVDISTIGLFDLRSKLTIIPQDPVLFNGSLRSNLDPLDQHSDDKLWEALKRVHFMESMQQPQGEESSLTLEYPVAENGSNFSQGQRQLLCLARSLLQGNKIIFLDEATASVDNETDARIQQTIRSEFASSTIVCIAHRLRTIIDYDKVLVLEKGEVAEFGTPIDLIENSPVGTFRSMCEETGEFEELVEIARKSRSG